MKQCDNEIIQGDLTVIGTGMAGLCAALFALHHGLSVVLTGKTSSMPFATGLMDLMGVFPPGREWDNPWDAIHRVRKELQKHPFGKITHEEIESSMEEIRLFLNDQGLFYQRQRNRNVNIMTSIGTVKKSHMIPGTMWQGAEVLKKHPPTLLINFMGLKIYSARQIVSTLGLTWQGLRDETIRFPDTELLEEVYPEHLARSLDIPENRRRLAERIKPLLKGVQAVGFPAMLGMYTSRETVKDMEALLGGVTVFEIPTPPVSVPGIRLQEAFLKGLRQKKELHYLSDMVSKVKRSSSGKFRITAGVPGSLKHVESQGVLLATGRFLGKGLTAERTGIRETLMDIPVIQPGERKKWHRNHLFDPRGHPVNCAGIEVDSLFRPLVKTGSPFLPGLFAAGSILAHCDWTRLKCGSGVAIASAHAAVNAFLKYIHEQKG